MFPIAMILSLVFQGAKLPVSDLPTEIVVKRPADGIAAKVNGVDIKVSDVDALLWDWRKDDVLDDLIAYRLVKTEAGRLGLKATDEEIKAEVNNLFKAITEGLEQGKSITQAMAEQGTTLSRIHMRVATEVLIRKVILFAFKPEEFVDISTITVKPASDSATDLKHAIEMADGVYQRLQRGEAFDAVLLSVSQDQNAIKARGKIGWRLISALPDAVRKEIVTLKAGQFTKPAQTVNGLQVFRIDTVGKEAKDEQLKAFQDWYVNGMRLQTVDRLRKSAKIERF
ncbi:MAG: peptidylprolyl isomerase [Fimbriimonadaceae bacterium]